jgi:DNA-binding CsgD family transcriptional regulator
VKSVPEDADYHLTPHEIRILKLLVEGHNQKPAAAELSVSVNTIRFHLRSTYAKFASTLEIGGCG